MMRSARNRVPDMRRDGRLKKAARATAKHAARAVRVPAVRTFTPLIMIAAAALFITWSSAVQFTYMSMGFAAGLVALATALTVTRFVLGIRIQSLMEDKFVAGITIFGVLLTCALCMLAG